MKIIVEQNLAGNIPLSRCNVAKMIATSPSKTIPVPIPMEDLSFDPASFIPSSYKFRNTCDNIEDFYKNDSYACLNE